MCGFLLLAAISLQAALTPDEPLNPWLRPHFTVQVRSRESRRMVEGEMLGAELRHAVRGEKGSNFIATVHPKLPAGAAIQRTYLRCLPLGWVYGGHTLDVLSIDALEYEAILRDDGRIVFPLKPGHPLLRTDRNEFLMAGRNCVATLRLPGGFDGTAGEIDRTLKQALAEYTADVDSPDWTVAVQFRELADPAHWKGLEAGVQSAIQPRDSAAELDGIAKTELGKVLLEFALQLFRDAVSCTLTATRNDEDCSGVVRLTITARPDSQLQAEFRKLSRQTALQQLPLRFVTSSAISGVSLIPTDSALARAVLSLRAKMKPADVPVADVVPTHVVFGTTAAEPGNRQGFTAFCSPFALGQDRSDHHRDTSLCVVVRPDRGITVLNSNTENPAIDSDGIRAAVRSLTDALASADDKLRRPCWLVAHVRAAECLPFLFPRLDLQKVSLDEVTDTVQIAGYADNDTLTVEIRFPPKSDQYVDLLFEFAIERLQALGKSLPFNEHQAAGSREN